MSNTGCLSKLSTPSTTAPSGCGSGGPVETRILLGWTKNTLRNTSPPNPRYRFGGWSESRTWDLNGTTPVALPVSYSEQEQDYFGNVTKLIRTTQDGSLVWRQTTENNLPEALIENRTADWILGRIKKSRVTHEAPTLAAQLARYPGSAGSSPNATANTWSPLPPPPLTPEQLAAVMQVIQTLLLDD
jgi:hypothetical protein